MPSTNFSSFQSIQDENNLTTILSDTPPKRYAKNGVESFANRFAELCGNNNKKNNKIQNFTTIHKYSLEQQTVKNDLILKSRFILFLYNKLFIYINYYIIFKKLKNLNIKVLFYITYYN